MKENVRYTVAWFSAGVSSAVATRLAVDDIDQIFYIHIDDQHPDTLRFVRDCEVWFGRPVTFLQSGRRNVESAVIRESGKGYINGPHGANCTRVLKKFVRKGWEESHPELYPMRYVWGMDAGEVNRADPRWEVMG